MAIKTYRVKTGQTFGSQDQYKAGDTLQMEESQAAAFTDKLRLVDEAESLTTPPELKNELGATVPEDLKLIPNDPETESEESESDEPGIKLTEESLIPGTPEKKKPGRKPKGK